ncbi:MAG: glycosyltransferase [Sedimentisphaerales bacterium]|nr:glycosyltransferase [Sedimentisphaerales bacterium]
MKIAYIVSGMKMPFVISEIEAHEQAGWHVLPLASCSPEQFQDWSEVMIKWCRRTIYRSNVLVQIWMTLREMVTHPLRFWRVCFWVVTLLFRSPVEFVKAVYEIMTVGDFAHHCRRFGVEHIHVHFASRSLSLGIMLGMLMDLPVSCTVHAFDIFTKSSSSLRPRLAKCKFIAAISQFNIEYIRRACGQSIADLCYVVHCGIDIEKFRKVSHQPKQGMMVCVARLESKKGLDIAIETCAGLKRKDIDFRFRIIGDGPEKKHLEEQIHALNLEDRVELLGPKANDQLIPFYSGACLFFMPAVKTQIGDMDGIPVAMMEAMACEVPIVSTRISGIPELVQHGINGLLVETRDDGRWTMDEKQALTDAVECLLSNPDKVRRFGHAARQQVEQNFNVTRTAAQLRQLIQELNHENAEHYCRNSDVPCLQSVR